MRINLVGNRRQTSNAQRPTSNSESAGYVGAILGIMNEYGFQDSDCVNTHIFLPSYIVQSGC
jgi:hypothetical protein